MSTFASVGGTVKFWNPSLDPNLSSFSFVSELAYDKLTCFDWNHTNQVLAIGNTERKIRLVEANTGKNLVYFDFNSNSLSPPSNNLLATLPTSSFLSSLSFSLNSKLLTASLEKEIKVFDLKYKTVKFFNKFNSNIVSSQFNSFNNLIVLQENGYLSLFNCNSSTLKGDTLSSNLISTSKFISSSINCMCLSSSNEKILGVGSYDGTCELIDLEEMKLFRNLNINSLNSNNFRPENEKLIITSINFSHKNERILTLSDNYGTVYLLDIRDNKVCNQFSITSSVSSLCFNESAIRSLIGNTEGQIEVRDWRNPSTSLYSVMAHNNSPVYKIAFENQKKISKQTSEKTTLDNSNVSLDIRHTVDNTINQSYNFSNLGTNLSIKDIDQQDKSKFKISSSNFTNKTLLQSGEDEFIERLSKNISPTNNPSFPQFGKQTYDNQNLSAISAALPPPLPTAFPTSLTSTSVNNSTISPNYNIDKKFELIERKINENEDEKVNSNITINEFQEAINDLKYEFHLELQDVIREQNRQNLLLKDEISAQFIQMTNLLNDLLKANKELREENERLRKIH